MVYSISTHIPPARVQSHGTIWQQGSGRWDLTVGLARRKQSGCRWALAVHKYGYPLTSVFREVSSGKPNSITCLLLSNIIFFQWLRWRHKMCHTSCFVFNSFGQSLCKGSSLGVSSKREIYSKISQWLDYYRNGRIQHIRRDWVIT